MRRRFRCPTLIGRDAELERVAEVVAGVEDDGIGRLVLVAGDAGAGKSRFVDQVAASAVARGWRAVRGGGIDLGGGGTLTHVALTQVVRDLAAQVGVPELERLVGAGFDELAAFLPGGTPVEVSSGRLLEKVVDALVALGRDRPLLVLLEDLHWADGATRDLVTFLARNVSAGRVLVIGTYRTDDLHRRHPLRPLLAELERMDVPRVALEPLATGDVAAFATAMGATDLLPHEVAALATRTSGNPFFLEELLAEPAADAIVPGPLREVLLARIDRLDPSTSAVLRPASVLGAEIDERLLEAVSGASTATIEEALRNAVSHQILDVGTQGCRFRHDLVREVVYDELLPGERHRFHEAAARALEEDPSLVEPEGRRRGMMAHHWRIAGDRGRACAAALDAAAWAYSVGAPGEGADLDEAALETWDASVTSLTRADVIGRAADARRVAGQATRGVALARAALDELRAGDDVEAIAVAHRRLGDLLYATGDDRAAAAELQRATDLLDGRPPSSTKAAVLARYAGFLMVRQQSRAALRAAEEAVALARRVGDRTTEAHAIDTMGVVHAQLGDADAGVAALRRSFAIAEADGDVGEMARARQNLTYVQLFAGRADDALTEAVDAIELVRRQGTMLSAGIGITEHAAEAEVRRGHFDAALAWVDQFPYESLDGITVCMFAAPRFDVALRRGDLDAAAAALAPALERAQRMDDCQFGANTRIRAAQLALARGDLDAARDRLTESFAICERADDFIYLPKACWVAVAVEAASPARLRRPLDAVVTRLDRLEAGLQELGGRFLAEPAGHLAAARSELASISSPTAVAEWTATMEAWQRCGDVYWVAAAQHRLAGALLQRAEAESDDRGRGAALAGAALATAQQLGARPLADALVTMLRRARLTPPAGGAAPSPDAWADLGLTPREVEVLELVVEGKTNRQIATALFISEKTASVHVTNLLRKLGVASRVEAADLARRR
jgi:DNA-binding CsgD family transcriptional regulator/tetratricopeptide (TPR) repeat protein